MTKFIGRKSAYINFKVDFLGIQATDFSKDNQAFRNLDKIVKGLIGNKITLGGIAYFLEDKENEVKYQLFETSIL